MSAATIEAAVPPACRVPVERAPRPVPDGAGIVVELGPWRPRRPARHLLPSFSALTPSQPSFRFELSARTGEGWSPWVATVTLGDEILPPLPATAAPLEVDVDVLVASEPIAEVRLRLRLAGSEAEVALRCPWLVTMSASDLATPPRPVDRPGRPGAHLPVPALTQMVEAPAIAPRICSPTSVAMVLAHFGAADPVARVAADAFHPGLDRYGVWPAAIAAAARRRVLGYLLRFPDWPAAAWCLDHGLPVIASVRFGRGELAGAPLDETTGHLVVVTGYRDGDVLVNDPAAPTAATVPRRYARAEFVRAWLGGSGVGYVLFPSGEARAADRELL